MLHRLARHPIPWILLGTATSESAAYAYIDPGVSSSLGQFLYPLVSALVAAAAIGWRRVRGFVARLVSRLRESTGLGMHRS